MEVRKTDLHGNAGIPQEPPSLNHPFKNSHIDLIQINDCGNKSFPRHGERKHPGLFGVAGPEQHPGGDTGGGTLASVGWHRWGDILEEFWGDAQGMSRDAGG